MRKHRRPRFVELSRNKRADMAFSVKHLIRKDEYDNFYTHHVLDSENSWADVLFLGLDKATFFNATIMSPAERRNDILWDMAWDEAEALVPYTRDFKLDEWLARGREPIPEFGERTRVEYVKNLVDSWAADESLVRVHAMAQIDTDYVYGIGLEAVLDEPFVTADGISRFIDRFRENGELAYVMDDPVPFDVVNAPTAMGNAIKI